MWLYFARQTFDYVDYHDLSSPNGLLKMHFTISNVIIARTLANIVLLQSELDISGNIVTLSAFERKCYEFTATEFWGGGKG